MLVCIVGGARTLAVPAVHESIRVHVLESLRASAERVDVVSLLIDDDSDAPAFNRGGGSANATRCHGDPTTALKQLGPLVDDLRIKKSDCAHFRTVADDRTADRGSGGGARGVTPARCVDDSLWLQFAWIDMCLRRGMKLAETEDRSTKHSHFIRMRPDSFFAAPLPDLRHFPLAGSSDYLVKARRSRVGHVLSLHKKSLSHLVGTRSSAKAYAGRVSWVLPGGVFQRSEGLSGPTAQGLPCTGPPTNLVLVGSAD